MGPVFHNTNRSIGDLQRQSPASIYNETFTFVFDWYLLALFWVLIWHPVLLRLWLGPDLAAKVAPLFIPILAAFCLNATANISGPQLSALNRVGAMTGFMVAAGILAGVGVYVGWKFYGLEGAAYGFLLSRIAFIAQDLFTIRLIKAQGWLGSRTWAAIGMQGVVGIVFAVAYFFIPRTSFWLLIPAAVHGATVATWLLRHPLKKLLANPFVGSNASAIAVPPASE